MNSILEGELVAGVVAQRHVLLAIVELREYAVWDLLSSDNSRVILSANPQRENVLRIKSNV
jgi:hypothetical protein